jgi:spore maturation protein CgeB
VLPKLRIAYFAHSLRSDWNNGNAHFLRGLMRAMVALGHEVNIFEPRREWSIENLLEEADGEDGLRQFTTTYRELQVSLYETDAVTDPRAWRALLREVDVVLVHEWNPPALAHTLLNLRQELGYRMLFHDTHHRASSSPEQIERLGIDRFDGVVAFGEVLRMHYQQHFGLRHVWTLHEAADTTVFYPRDQQAKQQDVVWIGNWGDEERSTEIREFLLEPATMMRNQRFTIYGVRYPEAALRALSAAGVRYGGYLPNLRAPAVYSESRLTVHVPRRQYAREMLGIPTIRVFEALACGIPLISAPWSDVEELFRPGDIAFAADGEEMYEAVRHLLKHPESAADQAARGLETVQARHTCTHRAAELTEICKEVLR